MHIKYLEENFTQLVTHNADGRMILKYILYECVEDVWTEVLSLRIGTSGGLLRRHTEHSGSINYCEVFMQLSMH
jgi:hypothetical protein